MKTALERITPLITRLSKGGNFKVGELIEVIEQYAIDVVNQKIDSKKTFKISKTVCEDDTPPHPNAYTFHKSSKSKDWFIDIYTLDELIELSKDKEIIIGFYLTPYIEIYNGYRE